MNESNICDIAKFYADSKLITVGDLTQIFFSSLSVVALLLNLPIKRWGHRPMVVHPNLKIIAYNAAFFYFLHATITILYQGRTQLSFLFYEDPCDLVIEYWKCVLIKNPSHLAVIGFTFFHVALSLERSLSVIYPSRYENSSSKFGVYSTIVMWSCILLINVWIYQGEDFDRKIPYCVLTTPTNGYKWVIELGTLMVIDIIVLIVDVTITIVNRRMLKRHLVNPIFGQNFLTNAYQLNENARAMSIILPISIAHSVCYVIFLASTVFPRLIFNHDYFTIKVIIECSNILVSFYTMIIPLVYFKCRRNLTPRNKIMPKGSNETEIYFKLFNETINMCQKMKKDCDHCRQARYVIDN